LTDVVARRPSSPLGRVTYREPKAHHASFQATIEALSLGSEDRMLELAAAAARCSSRSSNALAAADRLAMAGQRTVAGRDGAHGVLERSGSP